MPDLFSFLVDPQARRRLMADALDDETDDGSTPGGLLGPARDDATASVPVVQGLLSAPSAPQRLLRGLLGGDDGAGLPFGADDLHTLLTAPAQIAAPQDDAQFAQLLQQIASQNTGRSDRAVVEEPADPSPQSVVFTPEYNAQRAGLGAWLGNADADRTATPATQGQGPWSAADYRNGSDIDSDPAALQRPQDPPTDDGRADIERENRLLASRTRTITGTSPAGMITQDGHNYYLISRDKDGLGVYQQLDSADPGVEGAKVMLPRVTVTGPSQATAAANTAETLRLQNRSKTAGAAQGPDTSRVVAPAPAEVSERPREPQPADAPAGAKTAPSQLAPNQYGYDLGTQDGMRQFLNDIAKRKAVKAEISPQELATAQTLLSTYYGLSGPMDKALHNWGKLSAAQAQEQFDGNTGRYKLWTGLNDKYGTHVDFSALTQFEGGQQTTGYVPKKKSGAVVGNSGVTVATGFDVGQKNPAGIRALGLSNELTGRLTPYAAMTKNAAVSYLAEHPLEVSRADAMDIDRAVKGEHLSAAIASWNRLRPAGTPAFADLTPAQQTVIFSRTFHQGVGLPKDKTALPFYAAAQANRWADAEANLRNYRVEAQWYKDRVAKEANLLKAERDRNAN